MRLTSLPAALCIAALLIQGCAGLPSNAVVDDRSATWQKGLKSSDAPRKLQELREPAPVVDAPGFYTVRKGDTLLRIAQQFNQPWRELADWNGLSDPNEIKVGQQLRVVAPEGARMASVPVDTGIEIRPLSQSTTPPAQASTATSARSPAGLKTGPLGNKVAFSEQALIDLKRPDSARGSEPPKRLSELPVSRFVWPTEGKLIRGYDPARKGIDIAGQSGQPVVAAGDGTVLYAKNMRGYGNLVIVDHGEGLVSAYAHNKTILVKEGQTVTRGQRIAEMGDTDAESVRLHFEIRQLGKPVDPLSFLPSR